MFSRTRVGRRGRAIIEEKPPNSPRPGCHPYGITDFGQEPTFLAKHSCAWCVSACPWRATPTVSSGGQRLLPPRQPALGHGLLHLPAVEEAVRERYRLAGHLQGHPARGSVMGLQHLPELL